MGGNQASASIPAAPQGEQRKEAEAGSGCIERHIVDIAHRSPMVGASEAVPLISDMPSEISGMGAAESVSEDSPSAGTAHGTGGDTESRRMLH